MDTNSLGKVVAFVTLPLASTFWPSSLKADENEDIVRMLIIAQTSMMEAFPEGSMVADVDDGYAGRAATATVTWRKQNFFCDASTVKTTMSAEGELVENEQRMIYIRRKKKWDYYFPDSALLQRVSDNRMSGLRQLMLVPSECWFRTGFTSDRTYREILEELVKPDSQFTYKAQDVGDGTIRLEWQHNSNWDRSVTVFSMKHGGAVVSDESFPIDNRAEVRSRTTFSWLPTKTGTWRLDTYKYQMTDADDDSYSDGRAVTIKIKSFETEPKIARNRFEISSLSLPKGTWVEELGANERRYRIGGNQKAESGISEVKFQSLADELSQSQLGGSDR